jgi:hypothetical protein
MIGKLIRDALGDALELVPQLAESRNALIRLYQAYKNPIAFVNNYLKNFPTSSRAWGGLIYRVSRYFHDQGDILPLAGEDTPLDSRLAGKIPLPDDIPGMAFGFRYNISFNVDAKQAGQFHTFNFWVNSTGLLSESDVAEMAGNALLTLVNRYNLTFESGQSNSAIVTSSQINDFVQYIPGLKNG